MTDPTTDNISQRMNHLKLKEPPTPPYSIMLKNSGVHARSSSYSFDSVYDAKMPRPRAYSSSVFDFDYIPSKSNLLPQISTGANGTVTPKQPRNALFIPGQVTPPEMSPYSQNGDSFFYSPQTPITPVAINASSSKAAPVATGVVTAPPPLTTPVAPSSSNTNLSSSPTFGGSLTSLGTPTQIYGLCRDQKGCRVLQHKLQEGNQATVATIFDATVPHMVSLMIDPFGNYFCQKLIEYCTASQITRILQTIHPCVVDIALNQHGTRALQKIVEHISLPEHVNLLVTALDGSVVRIIRDINGNHVVQRCLVELDPEGAQFIYDSVYCNVISVGTHRHGCCVLQRCLDSASPANKRMLVSQIVAKSLSLVRDPFGNYVCQYVLDLKVHDYTFGLISQILGNLSELSTQKFSSNVIEKCLWAAEPDQKLQMTKELLAPRTLQKLLLDPYGNYVIQTTLECSTGPNKNAVIEAVHNCLNSTRTPYGRRIMSKLKVKALSHDK